MSVLDVNGTSYATDDEGYLETQSDWSEAVAIAIAAAEDITLNDGHWEVIRFLHEYYEEFQIAPPIRILTKAIGRRLGKDKGNSKYLYELFPDGPAKQACKFAGLPRPTGCV